MEEYQGKVPRRPFTVPVPVVMDCASSTHTQTAGEGKLRGSAHVTHKDHSKSSRVHSHLHAGNTACLGTKIESRNWQKGGNEEKIAT